MRHQKGPEERYVINFDKLTTESTFSVSFKVGGFKRNLDSCRSKRRKHETLVDQSLFYYNESNLLYRKPEAHWLRKTAILIRPRVNNRP